LPTQNTSTGYKNSSSSVTCPSLKRIETVMKNFIDVTMGYAEKNIQYTINGLDMLDIILRVDKRISYFKYFHNMNCNEVKRAALYAYWIVKLRPIIVTDPRYADENGYNNMINELFAVHYLFCALNGMERIKLKTWDGPDGVELTLDNPFIKRLVYSFRFRNISIDAIIVLADAITTDTLKLEEKDVYP
jgi:hypothetical protein